MNIKERIVRWWYTSHGSQIIHGNEASVYKFKGQYHREEGPAIIFRNGSYEYRKYGLLHREDGPAVLDLIADKYFYYIDGKLHRLDGPAITLISTVISKYDYNEWFYKGKRIKCYSQKEFEKHIKLLAFS